LSLCAAQYLPPSVRWRHTGQIWGGRPGILVQGFKVATFQGFKDDVRV
jgi:hypothetical protein